MPEDATASVSAYSMLSCMLGSSNPASWWLCSVWNCGLNTVLQAASPQPRTPTRKARPGLHLEVSSATRAPRAFKKRGAFGDDDDGDAESDRIKTLTESFVGSRGRVHNLTLLYVQEDINESFANSEHAAVALMWSGSGVGKIAKDYKIKKKVSMLGNAFEGMCAQTIVRCVRFILYVSILRYQVFSLASTGTVRPTSLWTRANFSSRRARGLCLLTSSTATADNLTKMSRYGIRAYEALLCE